MVDSSSACFFACLFSKIIRIATHKVVPLPSVLRITSSSRASKSVSLLTLLTELNRWRYSAAPRHTKNKLLSAIDGHRLLSQLDIVQVHLTLCSPLHQFSLHEHCTRGNGTIVSGQTKTNFLGQNPSRRPTRKILSADKIKSPLLERPAVSERKGWYSG